MAGLSININSIAENTARLGERISENLAERTRELALTRAAGYLDVSETKVHDVRRQLESNSEGEKLDALKTLIALISKGRNVIDFFPSVVKNVASPNLEIRKLVYIYLLRYAETEPDLALLSINTFQRDLADPNPLIRAMALRVLSGINVPMVGNLVILAVKKCAGDPSPYVRKAAALATIKCYRMDSGHLPSLLPIVTDLLKDSSALAIGATVVAFASICPTRLDLLHPHYRRLCKMLLDIDAWGQVSVMELLSRYARVMLAKPNSTCLSDLEEGDSQADADADLTLLLASVKPLLMSCNPAVVLAAARLIYYLGTKSQLSEAIGPLLRLMSISRETERVVLASLLVIADRHPATLTTYYTWFLTISSDLPVTRRIKLCILLRLATTDNYRSIVNEFVTCASDEDGPVVGTAVNAIGYCAVTIGEAFTHCLDALLAIVKSGQEPAVTESVLVLKAMVQMLASAPDVSARKSVMSLTADLASNIHDFSHPSAKACVLWLIGQFCEADDEASRISGDQIPGLSYWVADALRQVTKTFRLEEPIVKLQLLSLAAKIQVLVQDMPSNLTLLVEHVFNLARYDENYDVRDRARMLGSLLAGFTASQAVSALGEIAEDEREPPNRGGVILRREQVKLILFEGKMSSSIQKPSINDCSQFGTLMTLTGKSTGLDSWLNLPEWLEQGTESTLRDTSESYSAHSATSFSSQTRPSSAGTQQFREVLRPTTADAQTSSSLSLSGNGPAKKQWANLDEFLNEAPEEESEGSDESSSDEDIHGEVEPAVTSTQIQPSQQTGGAASNVEDDSTSGSEEDNTSSE